MKNILKLKVKNDITADYVYKADFPFIKGEIVKLVYNEIMKMYELEYKDESVSISEDHFEATYNDVICSIFFNEDEMEHYFYTDKEYKNCKKIKR